MKPTAQQQAFLDAITGTRDNLALVARAGCGKTSTILLGVDTIARAFPRAETTVCAFNKSIATEVKEKLEARGHRDFKRVSAGTLHSLGYGLVRYVFNPREITDKKVRRLIEAKNADVYAQYGAQIAALVSYAKGAGFGFFPELAIGNVAAWHDLADHYDVNGLDDTSEADAVVEAAQLIYKESLAQTDVIDYDDMILFPLIKNLRVKFQKDYLILDEAQDLSRTRQALARKFVKPGGRMFVVGDDRQAIYGFSGADAAALPNLIEGLSARVLPLSVTWRCPRAVVREAQRYVPDIEAADGAPEGEVLSANIRDDEAMDALMLSLGAEDAILCRNTAPLIQIAYKLIRRGKACRVEGRAIGEGLEALARRWKVRTLDTFLNRLDTYQDREVQKAQAKGNDAKAEEVTDKCETLREIARGCLEQGKTTVNEMCDFVSTLFADGATGVTVLATYHRSKGREWPRVLLWEHGRYCPSRAAKKDWQRAQEDNLAYVAITRAQRTLIYVG